MSCRQTRNSLAAAMFTEAGQSNRPAEGEITDASQGPTQANSSGPSASAGNNMALSQDMLAIIREVATQAAVAAVGANSEGSQRIQSQPTIEQASTVSGTVSAALEPSANSGSGMSQYMNVPAFLNTFSLPAESRPPTSSASLVAASASATNSSSNLTPVIGQDFVVGPGFAPVPAKLVNQITAGKFVDLSELLSPNLLQAQAEPQVFLDGRFVMTTSAKKLRKRVDDISSWLEAFSIYSLILASKFPHRWVDLTKYKLLILRTHRQFGGRVWLSYDDEFRRHAAALNLTDWSVLNVEIYNVHAAGSSQRPSLSVSAQSQEASGSSSSDIVCRSWNRGRCSSPYQACVYAHKCSSCAGDHRASDCKKADVPRRRSASPSWEGGREEEKELSLSIC